MTTTAPLRPSGKPMFAGRSSLAETLTIRTFLVIPFLACSPRSR